MSEFKVPYQLQSLYEDIIYSILYSMTTESIAVARTECPLVHGMEYSFYNPDFFNINICKRKLFTIFSSIDPGQSYVTLYPKQITYTAENNPGFVGQIIHEMYDIIRKNEKQIIEKSDRITETVVSFGLYSPAPDAESTKKYVIDQAFYEIPKKWLPLYQVIANAIYRDRFDMKFRYVGNCIEEHVFLEKGTGREFFRVSYSTGRDENTYLSISVQPTPFKITPADCQDLIRLVHDKSRDHRVKLQQQQLQTKKAKTY